MAESVKNVFARVILTFLMVGVIIGVVYLIRFVVNSF